MILGLGESEKQFKNAMEAAGADMSVVNSWLKLYQRTKKNSVNVTNKYYVVKANLNKLLSDLKEIEQLIISDEQDPAVKKKIGSLIRDCKSMKNEFDDEFLINKDDKDFHMTLESVIKLGTEFCVNRSCGDHIIFQSEVENLIHLAEEGASREKPDLFALSYFYLEHSNKDLQELNFRQKIDEVHGIFKTEFYDGISKEITSCVVRANKLKDDFGDVPDKKAMRVLKELKPLLSDSEGRDNAKKVCDSIMESMCKVSY